MQKANVIIEGAGNTYNIDKNTFEDIDLTQFSDAELSALGIDPSEVEREEDESEVLEDESEEDNSEEDESEEDNSEEDNSEKDESEEDNSEEDESEEDNSEEDLEDKEEEENRIPHSRVSKMVQKERDRYEEQVEVNQRLQEQINQLLQSSLVSQNKAEEVVEEVIDIDALEEKYIEHILNAEIKEARAIRTEINTAQKKLTEKVLKEQKELTRIEYKAELEEERKKEVINQALQDYPILDSNHTDYDRELVSEVNALAIGLQNSGLSADKALTRAINRLVKPLVDQVKEDKKPKSSSAKPKTIERRKEKAARVSKEPPRANASKIKDAEIDWENMSESEFETLYKKNPRMVEDYLNKPHH